MSVVIISSECIPYLFYIVLKQYTAFGNQAVASDSKLINMFTWSFITYIILLVDVFFSAWHRITECDSLSSAVLFMPHDLSVHKSVACLSVSVYGMSGGLIKT